MRNPLWRSHPPPHLLYLRPTCANRALRAQASCLTLQISGRQAFYRPVSGQSGVSLRPLRPSLDEGLSLCAAKGIPPGRRPGTSYTRSCPPHVPVRRPPHIAITLALALAVALSVTLPFLISRQSSVSGVAVQTPYPAVAEIMADLLPGRPGNLTPEQEEKLRQLWSRVFQVCGVGSGEHVAETSESLEPVSTKDRKKSDLAKTEKEKKKRRSLFSRKPRKESVDNGSATSKPTATEAIALPKEGDQEDKYGQAKLFRLALANQSPESIRATIWGMVKHDHPDALVLRFLRARKWDVDGALVMLVSTMHWRAVEMHVDDDIMKNGEAAAVEAENGSDPKAKKLGHDFLAQIRMGKSFLHGVDKDGRPICLVRVRLHHQGEQAEESLERYTVYIIETARMVLTPPVDTAVSSRQVLCWLRQVLANPEQTVVFDMTDFSMANMVCVQPV